MSEPDDQQLLKEFTGANSEAAFATLVSRHVNLVYSTALRFAGNPQAAEEISQAVFVILARKAAGLRSSVVLSGWLYQTARLTAANYVKHETRRQQREQEAYMQSTLNEPDAPPWQDIAPLLDEAMGGLGETDHNAVVLRFFENKTSREVAMALKTTEAAAHKRVHRALEKLRKFFAKRGVVWTATMIAGAVSANSVHAAPIGLASTISTVAAAQGTAASASTLTLVKGTLKLMAWTKTKIVIVTAAVALLAAGTGVVTIHAINAMRTDNALHRMQGNWEGTLDIGPEKLRVVFHIFKTNDTWVVTQDSIDQGVMGIHIPQFSATGNSLDARVPAIDGELMARINPDDSEMSGTWKQLKNTYPLTLVKTDTPDAVTAMPTDQYAPRADSDLQGTWSGAISVGKVSLRLSLRISEPSPGSFQALMDSPDQGVSNLPITSFTYQKPAVRYTMDGINAVYEGNVNAQDDRIQGTWSQLGQKYPLTFQRAQTNSQTIAEADADYGQGNHYEMQGHWKGVLNVGGTQLHIVFNIAQMADGSYSATLDSPDQGAFGIAASETTVTYPNVNMKWNTIGGTFKGKLADGKLSGTWRQGKAFPLVLEKDKTK
jgi:RNA polymerase sigma factor (sigma-70 family)